MKMSVIIFLLLLPSCQYLSYPEEKKILLEYETKTLSPAPPMGYPPMRIPGAQGP